MPQIFQVLRCYHCLTFQVHQVKKRNKWECKICGEKQSMKKYYGIGNGKECRKQVQKLNNLHGAINEQSDSSEIDDDCENIIENMSSHLQERKGSKWDIYTDKSDHNTDECVEEETQNDTLLYQMENKSAIAVTGKTPKFIPPTKNTNSSDKKHEKSTTRLSDDKSKDISNSKDSVPWCTSETVESKTLTSNVNIYSKWAKFIKGNFNNNFQNMEDKNSGEYEENIISSKETTSKTYFLKNDCLQDDKTDIYINTNKTSVISIFDEGDFDALDI